MINEELRAELPEGAIILEGYAYDNSIVGITTDDRIVYDFYKMVEELSAEESWSEEDAMDWICCNTIRAIPYMGSQAPIIMYSMEVCHE